jgi:thioesterase domain-containing protein
MLAATNEQSSVINLINKEEVLVLQSEGSAPPVFIVPGAVGASDFYVDLAMALGKQQPVYAIQLQNILDKMAQPLTIAEIAGNVLHYIKKIQPQGTYRLIGHSLGGKIVYEVVKLMELLNETVATPIILDAIPNQMKSHTSQQKTEKIISLIYEVVKRKDLSVLLPEEWENKIKKEMPADFNEATWAYIKDFLDKISAGDYDWASLKRMFRIAVSVMDIEYVPGGILHKKLAVFVAKQGMEQDLNLFRDWQKYAEEIELIETPGDHLDLVAGKNAEVLAGFIKPIINV